MLPLYIIISLFISWIWIDYFRLIDVFQKNNLGRIIITFILGAISVYIVLFISKYIPFLNSWTLNDNYLNDFLFSSIKIGLVEEIAKILPLLIALKVFKSSFNEPIDYIAFACVGALGFAAVENVIYQNNYGLQVISGRAILSAVGHMFDTTLVTYGFVRVKFLNKPKYELALFLGLAALTHGFYDFWLISKDFEGYGWIITVLFFLITISLFATIINNSLNNSPFFNYKHMVNNIHVSKRLFLYYGGLFLSTSIIIGFLEGIEFGFSFLFGTLNYILFIIIVTCLRLSRMKLIKGRWDPLVIEFPFYYYPPFSFTVKGDSYNEFIINSFYNEKVEIHPLSYRNSYLDDVYEGYVEKKIFLKHDSTYYLLKLFNTNDKENFKYYLLKPKTTGASLVEKKHPIAALLEVNIGEINDLKHHYFDDFEFLEWVFLKNYD
jgi:RsiW-degrading membrane proteinase PrsW (M82 family)